MAIKTIMIVHESITIRVGVFNTFDPDRYEVLEAVSGPEALEQLAEGRVDIIIADVSIPKVNGTSFRQIIRTKKIPCVMITCENNSIIKAEPARPYKPSLLMDAVVLGLLQI